MHKNRNIAPILRQLDFGDSIAEHDRLLEAARVETTVLNEILHDRVDLIPGTKGSGKTALYRIVVEFLSNYLRETNKVVVAHGVRHHGDDVFQVFRDRFGKLSEDDFVGFWCIYLVSLANQHFVSDPAFKKILRPATAEVKAFLNACDVARIPTKEIRKPLREVLDWALTVLSTLKPRAKFKPPGESGEFEVGLFGEVPKENESEAEQKRDSNLPVYVSAIRVHLESILRKVGLCLWLMIDRLDEIFPRRSLLETRALRALLRTLRLFDSRHIRVKIFLRDDIFEQVVSSKRGFTALTHITSRKSKTLQWSEDQILTMIVKRLFAHKPLQEYCDINSQRLESSKDYRRAAFYKVFPEAVFKGPGRTTTLRWIYRHAADGRNVVTPRDVIEMLTRAKQFQMEMVHADPLGTSDDILSAAAIRHGFKEMSKWKRTTFLQAEFPHLWDHIEKFVGGKTEYEDATIAKLLGRNCKDVVDDLVAVGILRKERRRSDGGNVYKIPFLYREGLELTQGRMRW